MPCHAINLNENTSEIERNYSIVLAFLAVSSLLVMGKSVNIFVSCEKSDEDGKEKGKLFDLFTHPSLLLICLSPSMLICFIFLLFFSFDYFFVIIKLPRPLPIPKPTETTRD
jgi:hypothetical protein